MQKPTLEKDQPFNPLKRQPMTKFGQLGSYVLNSRNIVLMETTLDI